MSLWLSLNCYRELWYRLMAEPEGQEEEEDEGKAAIFTCLVLVFSSTLAGPAKCVSIIQGYKSQLSECGTQKK